MPAKRGRLSKTEMAYITRHAAADTAIPVIAAKLNRTPETVAAWVKEHPPLLPAVPDAKEIEQFTIKQELRSSAAWRQLKEEFVASELEYFEEQYLALQGQFRDDILPTENIQIMLSIKFEILMNRNLKSRARALVDIQRLEKMQADELKGITDASQLDEAKKEYLLNLETQLQTAKVAEQSKTKEFVDLEGKHEGILKNLKATRDQRISKIQSGKQSILGLIKAMQEEKVRDRIGRQAELMKQATAFEEKRLGMPHKYDDGNVDQPLLSAETVEMLAAVPADE